MSSLRIAQVPLPPLLGLQNAYAYLDWVKGAGYQTGIVVPGAELSRSIEVKTWPSVSKGLRGLASLLDQQDANQSAAASLNLVQPLDAARFTRPRPRLQPHERLLEFGQREGVLAAGELPGLETAQTIDADGHQDLLRDAVDAVLLDRAVLKRDLREYVLVIVLFNFPDRSVDVVGTPSTGLVNSFDADLLVRRVGGVIGDETGHGFLLD